MCIDAAKALARAGESHHGGGAQDHRCQAPHLESGALRAHVLTEDVCRQQVHEAHVDQDARGHLQGDGDRRACPD